MNYLPLVHRAWAHIGDGEAIGHEVVKTGTLGEVMRWMRMQPAASQARFVVTVQHHAGAFRFADLERIAAREAIFGDEAIRVPRAAIAA